MRSDSGACRVLTRHGTMRNLPGTARPIFLDTDRGDIERYNDANPSPVTISDDAYVINTSCSTGHSRGVVGIHRCAVNRYAWMCAGAYPFAAHEICCQKTSSSVAAVCNPEPLSPTASASSRRYASGAAAVRRSPAISVLRFREVFGDAVLSNIYGSTVASADVACFDTWRADADTGRSCTRLLKSRN
jgi:non-ribosomal peptide synthetase component F